MDRSYARSSIGRCYKSGLSCPYRVGRSGLSCPYRMDRVGRSGLSCPYRVGRSGLFCPYRMDRVGKSGLSCPYRVGRSGLSCPYRVGKSGLFCPKKLQLRRPFDKMGIAKLEDLTRRPVKAIKVRDPAPVRSVDLISLQDPFCCSQMGFLAFKHSLLAKHPPQVSTFEVFRICRLWASIFNFFSVPPP